MITVEKENFLKIYRDILEFNDGFTTGVGGAYFKDLEAINGLNELNRTLDDYTQIEIAESFEDFFMKFIRPIYEKLDDWLATIPVEQQRMEVQSLLTQIYYYIKLTDNYTAPAKIIGEKKQPKKIVYGPVSLNEEYPVIKHTLEIIATKLKKYLPETEPISETKVENDGREEFTTAQQVAAIMLLNQKFQLFKTQDNKDIERFIRFLTNKTSRTIGDFIKIFKEGEGIMHGSKKQNQKVYNTLKTIFEEVECKEVVKEIDSIILKISKLKN